jgi:transposase
VTQKTYYAGLDVAVKKTAICIVDSTNTIVVEGKVPTDPEAITRYLQEHAPTVRRVGLEAGQMSDWLALELIGKGLPMVCVEARHAHGFIGSQINKNDRNDARGLARMMMCGVFKPVHVKSAESQFNRALLGTRKFLSDKLVAVEHHIRGTLTSLGRPLTSGTRASFPQRVIARIGDDASLAATIEPLLIARDVLQEQLERAHAQVMGIAHSDPVCALLMTAPAVGPVTALTFKTFVDDPAHMRGRNAIGAMFGMTPRQHQSGERERFGEISKLGSEDLRMALCQAGLKILVNVQKPSALRAWGKQIEARRGKNTAAVAVGRRLGEIMLRMWREGRPFDPAGVAQGPSARRRTAG